MAVIAAVAVASLFSATGCDETMMSFPITTDYPTSVDYPINAATQNVPSWDGLANPYMTSSLGLPESPWSYWNRFFGG